MSQTVPLILNRRLLLLDEVWSLFWGLICRVILDLMAGFLIYLSRYESRKDNYQGCDRRR